MQFPCDEVGDVPGVRADSANQRRGYPEQEREPNDIQAGLIEDGAALMSGLLVARKLRQRDPGVVRSIPGTPDDVGDVKYAPVLELRTPVDLPDHALRALDAGFGHITRANPNQRSALARVNAGPLPSTAS